MWGIGTSWKLIRSAAWPCLCWAGLWVAGTGWLNATEYWMAGEDPVVQKDKHKNNPADYMDIFQPTAPWATGANQLTAFQISTQLVLRGTSDELKTVISGLKARNIALAIELGLLVNSDRCGQGTEGYASPLAVDTVARKIKDAGGQLDYVSIDEPVTWGHSMTGRNPAGGNFCHDSTAELADQVAIKIAILQRYFPNIRVGDIDAINSRIPGLTEGILSFTDELQKKTGIKLAFVHADVAWDSNWKPLLEQLAKGLRERGLPFGLICDGDENVGSDEAWTAQALKRCTDVSRNSKTRPEHFVVQSWEPLPTRMLPENRSGTLTYLLKQVQAIH